MASNFFRWGRPSCSQRRQRQQSTGSNKNEEAQNSSIPLSQMGRSSASSNVGVCGLNAQQPQASTSGFPNNIPVNVRPGAILPESMYRIRPQVQETLPDGSTRFKLLRYPQEAIEAIDQFRREGSLCDITLQVNGEQIRAHKVILAACSLYFRGMFTNGMREANQELVEIKEPNICAEDLRTLVDFAYTHEVIVSQDNVQTLLIAAIFLEMHHVIEACSLYLEQQLDPSNCLGIAHFASYHGCMDLEAKAKKYAFDHFCDVIKHDEFLDLDVNNMVYILKQDELNVKCETQVFQAVVRWVEHDPDNRLSEFQDLLDKVRLSVISPDFLAEKLARCHIIKKNPKCVELLLNQVQNLTEHLDCPDRPRKSGKSRVIYCVGGFYRKVMNSLNCFECYNPETKEWARLPDMTKPRCGPGVTSVRGLVFVVGGRMMKNGQHVDTCSVDVYNPEHNQWTTKCSMRVARARVGIGVLDGKVYAIGGSSGSELHKTAERYDLDSDQWESIADLNSVRVSAGVAVLNRLLYVIGGFDGRDRLKSVECYNPEMNSWQPVEPISVKRSGAGVAVLKDEIYVVGGFDGEHQLHSVEKYNPKTQVWTHVAPLSKARSGVAVAVIDDILYALGGFDGRDFLSCVESYDPAADCWRNETQMLCERSGLGVAVERRPSR